MRLMATLVACSPTDTVCRGKGQPESGRLLWQMPRPKFRPVVRTTFTQRHDFMTVERGPAMPGKKEYW